MSIGESGLGKSTLINSMFLTDIYNNDYPGPSVRGKKTVEVRDTFPSSFYCASCALHGICHGPVSVSVSVCPSQVGVLLKQLNA